MVRTLFAAFLLGIYTIVFGGLGVLTWPLSPSGAIIQKCAALWAWLTMKACGGRMIVEGLENVDRQGTYVFASNHLSTMDILALLYLQPTRMIRMVAKQSLFAIPFFGWAMRLAGFIDIDRSNKKSAMRSTNRALRTLQKGISLVVYPEGTRSRDGRLMMFKSGGFLMAIRARVPVIPVTMIDSDKVHPPDRFHVNPGPFKVIFEKPVPTDHLRERDRGALAAQVRAVVARRLAAEGRMGEEELREILRKESVAAQGHEPRD